MGGHCWFSFIGGVVSSPITQEGGRGWVHRHTEDTHQDWKFQGEQERQISTAELHPETLLALQHASKLVGFSQCRRVRREG